MTAFASPGPCRAIACRSCSRDADALVNNMRAGATDKVVYEAAATCLPVLASNPALDGFLPPELRFERDDPASLAERITELAAADRAALGPRAPGTRGARPLGRGLGAAGGRGGDPVTGPILHVGKVAGISGSEAHLLLLLPQLRARGFDVRFLLLHEDEPGAWEFAAPARGRRRPGRRRTAASCG